MYMHPEAVKDGSLVATCSLQILFIFWRVTVEERNWLICNTLCRVVSASNTCLHVFVVWQSTSCSSYIYMYMVGCIPSKEKQKSFTVDIWTKFDNTESLILYGICVYTHVLVADAKGETVRCQTALIKVCNPLHPLWRTVHVCMCRINQQRIIYLYVYKEV